MANIDTDKYLAAVADVSCAIVQLTAALDRFQCLVAGTLAEINAQARSGLDSTEEKEGAIVSFRGDDI